MSVKIELPPKIIKVFSKPRGEVRYRILYGGRGCVHPDTLIDTPQGQVKVCEFKGGEVYSWEDGKLVVANATPAQAYTEEDLYTVTLEDGRSIIVTDEHKFLTVNGWKMLSELSLDASILSFCLTTFCDQPQIYSLDDPLKSHADARHCLQKASGSQGCCCQDYHQYDQQLQFLRDTYQASLPLLIDALQHNNLVLSDSGGQDFFCNNNPLQFLSHLSTLAALLLSLLQYYESKGSCIDARTFELLLEFYLLSRQSEKTLTLDELILEFCKQYQDSDSQRSQVQNLLKLWCIFFHVFLCNYPCRHPYNDSKPTLTKIKSICNHSRQIYWDLHVFGTNNYLSNGIVNHNSGKSYSAALMALLFGYRESLRILCARELQVSIKESMYAELKNVIDRYPFLQRHYKVLESSIRGENGTEFLFRGLRHNMSAIKSMAGIDLCIVDEASDVPKNSWVELLPTIRAEGSEIWVLFNPKYESDPVAQMFLESTLPPRSIVSKINWSDNPFFPSTLNEQRLYALDVMNYQDYLWIWEGSYLCNSDSQVFANKYKVMDFTPTDNWDGPYFGMDFGFAQDPTCAVEVYINLGNLYIFREASKVGLELDYTSDYLKQFMPDIDKHKIRADSARPESISYLRRHGLPMITGVSKWPGSVEDGIAFLKSFRQIIIHERCKECANEFQLYSYKVDRLTNEVLPKIVDSHNHLVDSVRYAISLLIQNKGFNYSNLVKM